MSTEYLDNFERGIEFGLSTFLRQRGRMDERKMEMPDIEEKWRSIAEAYVSDGVREFQGYPLVSLGWMMYVGMAVAKMWDTNWEEALKKENLYTYLRELRGYDCMDEAIRDTVLQLKGEDYAAEEKIVGDCAQMVLNHIRREQIEPSTPMAYHAYIRALHQLYLIGAATELYRLGYRMTKATPQPLTVEA